MPKCDFNNVALLCNFIEIALRHGCTPVNLLHIFRTPFSKNTSGWLLWTFPQIITSMSKSFCLFHISVDPSISSYNFRRNQLKMFCKKPPGKIQHRLRLKHPIIYDWGTESYSDPRQTN